MLKRISPLVLTLSAVAINLFSGCTGGDSKVSSKRAGVNEAIIHIGADPQRLNPVTSSEAYAADIQSLVFQGLLDIDPKTYEPVPILAVARPEIKSIDTGEYKGGLTMTFEIRPEAKWDNGTQVAASDVEFTLKCYKNPMIDCEAQRGYLQFVTDIKIDPSNPRKFTAYCKDHYIQSEISLGTLSIIPEYVYDPNHLMKEFSVKVLNDTTPSHVEKIKSNDKIAQFKKEFEAEKYSREQGGVVGSGPYAFESWTTAQRVTLKRKQNWWGEALAKAGKRDFNAFLDKVTYEIIPDATTSITALKDERIDIEYNFKPKDFVDLTKNESAKKLFNMITPEWMTYAYLGMNYKSPKLADKGVRQALSYAIDRQYIISTYAYNLAAPTIGPFSPSKKYYNKDLKPYAYDLAKAKTLLDAAGWKDSDGDGIRDKEINGKKVDLKIAYKYPSSSPTAESIALLFKENCSKIGVGIELEAKEWTVFLDELKNHKFEMYAGSWVGSPVPDDPYQIWHSNSYANGSNYVGFGTAQSDNLIDSIRYELDDNKRDAMYKKLQVLIYEDAPYIFLYTPKNKLAFHKRFDNAEGTVKRPGFEVNQFKLNPAFGVKAVPASL